jgi:hypothetical protein
MSLQPIQVALGPYEKLEILREEKENLDKHLKAVERSIRDILREVERQKYLQSIAKYYRSLQQPEGVARLKQLEELRASIVEAAQAVERTYAEVERSAGSAGGAQAPRRPQSFEDFRKNR